jgi:lipopolysaccharide export system permease protein
MREFLKFFVITLLGLTAIALIAEFFDKVDEFYAKEPPLHLILQYLLLQSPKFILYALPMASLLAMLITIGRASKWKETIAVMASGGSLKKIFSSFLILGIFISLAALVAGEVIAPASIKRAAWVRNVKILKQKPRVMYREKAIWLKGLDGSLIRVGDFVDDSNRILDTGIYIFNASFGLDKRIEAKEGEWRGGAWELKDVTIFDFKENTFTKLESYTTAALEEPKIFREEITQPEEMGFAELYNYYSRLENAGFKNLKYMVRLYEKLAYPSVNFIMILFGIAIALNTGLGGGVKSAGLGIGISVLYWLVYSISISLGSTSAIPPWFAPFIAPLIFGIAGSVMFIRIKE